MQPANIKSTEKSNGIYYRKRLIEQHQIWQGRQVSPVDKKEPKMVNISITEKK